MNHNFPKPAQIDYLSEYQIIRYFRDLLNLHDLLLQGLEFEIDRFRTQLKNVGWSKDRVFRMYQAAASFSRYEQLIPHPTHGEKGPFYGF